MFRLIIALILMALRIILKILEKTGLIVVIVTFALAIAFDEIVMRKWLGLNITIANYPFWGPIYEKALIAFILIPPILVFVFKIVTFIKQACSNTNEIEE